MRGEFLDLGGARVYYYAAGTRGAGEPIVLLHGFPTCSHLWADVVPLLPAGHRVVVVDLLGYGRSDRPTARSVSLAGHAERTIALLDALQIEQACVVGHEIGGGIAQLMAARWPSRVSRVGLVNSVAFGAWPQRDFRLMRGLLPLTRRLPERVLLSGVRADLSRGHRDAMRASHSIERYLRAFHGVDGHRALVDHLAQLDPAALGTRAPAVPTLTQPVAIVCSSGDPFIPARMAERLHAAIPSSTLDRIDDARHFTPEEAPREVATIVGRLLAR